MSGMIHTYGSAIGGAGRYRPRSAEPASAFCSLARILSLPISFKTRKCRRLSEGRKWARLFSLPCRSVRVPSKSLLLPATSGLTIPSSPWIKCQSRNGTPSLSTSSRRLRKPSQEAWPPPLHRRKRRYERWRRPPSKPLPSRIDWPCCTAFRVSDRTTSAGTTTSNH